MPLVPCRECKKEVSENAKACPECGAPFPAKQTWSGSGYEWKSKKTIYGYPLIHVATGRDEKGKKRVAKGFIAIGQYGIGAITIAQFGIGFIFGFGQFILGPIAIAQFAIGLLFACGQFAVGYAAIGQFALGYYGIAQMGWAQYLWSSGRKDPEARKFFIQLAQKFGLSF